MKTKTVSRVLITALVAAIASSCAQSSSPNEAPSINIHPITASEGYLTRKAQYLAYCDANSGPGTGNLYGQVCRAYTGTGNYDEARINASLTKINNRIDCSDFDLNAIVRILYFDRENPTLPDALRDAMKATVLNFKYWMDEPGPDDMVWWSENHQILFHTVELIAGLLYPDEIFPNSGMTGIEHAEHARPMVHEWLDYRAKFGFSEWHSNVYFNEDMPPLVNLVDFADDPAIRLKASMVLNSMFFDTGSNYYKGLFATVHGRTYPDHFVGGLGDSITEAVWIVLGIVPISSINDLGTGNFSGTFIATSDNYIPPRILEDVAVDMEPEVEHRQRDGINVEDGPMYGLTYDEYEDVMFWWGMTGYLDPYIINGSFAMIDFYDLWKGNMWSDLTFLKPLVGTTAPKVIAKDVEPMAGGATLEAMNTYTYRTPYYQLSGAQDYKPFTFTGQATMWQATIDKDCFVLTAFPATFPFGGDFGSEWTGGFTPRATFYKNVGIIQYHPPVLGGLDYLFGGTPIVWDDFMSDYVHAYFPKAKFDEYFESPNWFFGRKGDSYVALGSSTAPVWKTDDPAEYDLQSFNLDNVWVIELGDAEHDGTFVEFMTAIFYTTFTVGATVQYDSPSVGLIDVGWTGPMKVNGEIVDLGPYDRWENTYANQEFGTMTTVITHGNNSLVMDFLTPQMFMVAH